MPAAGLEPLAANRTKAVAGKTKVQKVKPVDMHDQLAFMIPAVPGKVTVFSTFITPASQ